MHVVVFDSVEHTIDPCFSIQGATRPVSKCEQM